MNCESGRILKPQKSSATRETTSRAQTQGSNQVGRINNQSSSKLTPGYQIVSCSRPTTSAMANKRQEESSKSSRMQGPPSTQSSTSDLDLVYRPAKKIIKPQHHAQAVPTRTNVNALLNETIEKVDKHDSAISTLISAIQIQTDSFNKMSSHFENFTKKIVLPDEHFSADMKEKASALEGDLAVNLNVDLMVKGRRLDTFSFNSQKVTDFCRQVLKHLFEKDELAAGTIVTEKTKSQSPPLDAQRVNLLKAAYIKKIGDINTYCETWHIIVRNLKQLCLDYKNHKRLNKGAFRLKLSGPADQRQTRKRKHSFLDSEARESGANDDEEEEDDQEDDNEALPESQCNEQDEQEDELGYEQVEETSAEQGEEQYEDDDNQYDSELHDGNEEAAGQSFVDDDSYRKSVNNFPKKKAYKQKTNLLDSPGDDDRYP